MLIKRFTASFIMYLLISREFVCVCVPNWLDRICFSDKKLY